MSKHASGTFEVKMGPQPAKEHVGDPTVARLSIDKQFHGDLEAASKGQMLAVGADVKGSAGDVAIDYSNVRPSTSSMACRIRGGMGCGLLAR